MKYASIKSKAPDGINLEKILRLGRRVHSRLNFNEYMLESKFLKRRVRNDIVSAKTDIFRIFKIYREFINRGCNMRDSQDKERYGKIEKSFKSMRRELTDFEMGRGGRGGAGGLLKKEPFSGHLLHYRAILKRITTELIFDTLEEAAEEAETHREFYNILFKKTWYWCGTEIYMQYITEKEGVEGEREVELEEGEEPSDKELTTRIGEIA